MPLLRSERHERTHAIPQQHHLAPLLIGGGAVIALGGLLLSGGGGGGSSSGLACNPPCHVEWPPNQGQICICPPT